MQLYRACVGVKMGLVIIELKIMPVSPETDLSKLLGLVDKEVTASGAKLHKHEIQPVAFGLKALIITITADEDKGSTDALEEKISALNHVESVMVTAVSRALG